MKTRYSFVVSVRQRPTSNNCGHEFSSWLRHIHSRMEKCISGKPHEWQISLSRLLKLLFGPSERRGGPWLWEIFLTICFVKLRSFQTPAVAVREFCLSICILSSSIHLQNMCNQPVLNPISIEPNDIGG